MPRFTFNLDNNFEDLWRELERVQDGRHCHVIQMDGETPQEASKKLTERLIPFFAKNMEPLKEE